MENETVCRAFAVHFNVAQTETREVSEVLTESFIQGCQGSTADLRGVIDKLRAGFKDLQKNFANDVQQISYLYSLADSLFYKIVLFTVEEQWVARNQLRSVHRWPNLDAKTLKIIHSRLYKYLPRVSNKENQGLPKDPGIHLQVRIAAFLQKLDKILNEDDYENITHGSNFTEKEREAYNKRKADELNEQFEFRGKSEDFDERESIFWQINELSTADTEVFNWIVKHIQHLHWIILKTEQDEQILWFKNNALAAAIKEYFKIWKGKSDDGASENLG